MVKAHLAMMRSDHHAEYHVFIDREKGNASDHSKGKKGLNRNGAAPSPLERIKILCKEIPPGLRKSSKLKSKTQPPRQNEGPSSRVPENQTPNLGWGRPQGVWCPPMWLQVGATRGILRW